MKERLTLKLELFASAHIHFQFTDSKNDLSTSVMVLEATHKKVQENKSKIRSCPRKLREMNKFSKLTDYPPKVEICNMKMLSVFWSLTITKTENV